MEEQERAFDAFMRGLDQVEPVEASIEASYLTIAPLTSA